jgi:hypothetical protein
MATRRNKSLMGRKSDLVLFAETVAGVSGVLPNLIHHFDGIVDVHVGLAFELVSGTVGCHGRYFIRKYSVRPACRNEYLC